MTSQTLYQAHLSYHITSLVSASLLIINFTNHVLRLWSCCFYQLRQLHTIRSSLNEEATKTLFTHLSSPDTVTVYSLTPQIPVRQTPVGPQCCCLSVSKLRKFDHITRCSETTSIGYLLNSESIAKSVSSLTDACMVLHRNI